MVGCPRSGTSALAWALAEHPAFATGPESNFLWHLFRGQRARRAWDAVSRLEDGWVAVHRVGWEEFAAALGSGLARLFSSRSGGRRWVDSSPENLLIAEDLAALFPNSRFLLLVRDGRAVVNSMLHCGFDEAWVKDFDEACRTWAFYVARGIEAQNTLKNRMLTVWHGQLVDRPEAVCGEILRFLQERAHPGPARFLRTQRINSSYDNAALEDMKRPKDPARLRGRPWMTWPAQWHLRFTAVAGEAAAAVEPLARSGVWPEQAGDGR